MVGSALPVLAPQGRLAQQERNHVDLWILLLDLREKGLRLIVLFALKSVLRLEDGIKLPQLVLRIGESLLERFVRNCSAKSEVAEST